ncbi:hypothetical protein MAM1_0068c04061 [Mucor ambiguus]|uniref:Uncharacterized protein n=1 Tax=Mucor ambiguus TaxID=91626 RepID=A0A0C9LU88_9FUNG|nr:hypothetical protein MAM1_0068c04061 [Mucor ambiguus]
MQVSIGWSLAAYGCSFEDTVRLVDLGDLSAIVNLTIRVNALTNSVEAMNVMKTKGLFISVCQITLVVLLDHKVVLGELFEGRGFH